MSRSIRIKGEDCIFHIAERGNERKNIFNYEDDKLRFIETIKRMQDKYKFKIYSYCLMDNHVHLLIDNNKSDISKIMQSINISYTYYFNKTYNRCGHLFQDRFLSKLINDESYLLESSKYIHMNPVKAGMVEKPGDYKWSSLGAYSMKANIFNKFVESDLILGVYSNDRKKAVKSYLKYVSDKKGYNYEHIDIEDDLLGMDKVKIYIEECLNKSQISFQDLMNDRIIRNKLIREIVNISDLKYQEIGQLFGGLSKVAIHKIVKNIV